MSADRRVGKTKRATQAHAFACSGDDKIVIPIRVVLGDHRLADMEDLCMKTTTLDQTYTDAYRDVFFVIPGVKTCGP